MSADASKPRVCPRTKLSNDTWYCDRCHQSWITAPATCYLDPAYEDRPANVRQAVLDAANKAVNGERQLNYGKPESNFERIALLWDAHCRNSGIIDKRRFNAHDVAIMLALVKMARLANQPTHLDSWIDIAGYAACGAEVAGCQSTPGS